MVPGAGTVKPRLAIRGTAEQRSLADTRRKR